MFQRRTRGVLLSLLLGVPLAATIPGGYMIVAILGISFLIFIHEWGHFYACKLTGTRTETFSIGFGPRLFGWEKSKDGERRFTVGRRQLDPADHAMDFRIAVVPLGGYVKMAGEIPGEGGGDGGEPEPDEFPAKSALARSFIICAGVIMNFLTAIVFYTICIYGGKPFDPPVAGTVQQGGGAWQAGIRPGDRFLEINGNKTPTFIDLSMEIAFASKDDHSHVVIERDGKELALEVRPIEDEERGILVFGVGGVLSLSSGEGDEAFTIDGSEHALVNGVPTLGGRQALERIQTALEAGHTTIRLAKPDGSERTYSFNEKQEDAQPPEEKPNPKIGIYPYVHPVIKQVSGSATNDLEIGDELIAVHSAGERIEVESPSDFRELRFRPSIDDLILRREGVEKSRRVNLADPAAISAYLDQIAIRAPEGNRVKAFPAGRLLLSNGIYRYPSSPATEAGIPAGAAIVKVGDTQTNTFEEIAKAFEHVEAGKPVTLTIKATPDAEETTAEVVPVELEYIGQSPWELAEVREAWKADGLGNAFSLGLQRTWRETKAVFRTIGSLFSGTISFNKNIAGPITLVRASKRFAEEGFLRLLWFLGYVSVMLAVLNILPIPVLDGGHLMFILIEKIKGSPLKEQTMFNLQKVGMIMLLTLMFFAFKNDIMRLWTA
jgi:regulator of sigma E protease